MRWSATSEAPWRRSRAWPRQRSPLTSIRSIWLATPPHCNAKAAHEPTRPPPPMMLTFMGSSPPSFDSVWISDAAGDARGVRAGLDHRGVLPAQHAHDLMGDHLPGELDVVVPRRCRDLRLAVRRGRRGVVGVGARALVFP